jgi:hypothetical protein
VRFGAPVSAYAAVPGSPLRLILTVRPWLLVSGEALTGALFLSVRLCLLGPLACLLPCSRSARCGSLLPWHAEDLAGPCVGALCHGGMSLLSYLSRALPLGTHEDV